VLLASVPEAERRTSMHVVRPDGSVVSAGDAVIELLSLSPATRRQARVARLWPPRRRKIERDYRRLAERRAELSERVPDTPPTVVRPGWVRLPGQS
jgi:predicted DCC family thiol-disulfide oxidoreductase YuxK